MDTTLAVTLALIEATFPRVEGKLDPDHQLLDHGIDSLDRMELVVLAEERFGVDLTDDEIEGIATPRHLAATIDAALAAAQAQLQPDHTARPRGPVDDPLTQRDAEADGAVQGVPADEDAA